MAEIKCDVAGFEAVVVTIPDKWLYEHSIRYQAGLDNGPALDEADIDAIAENRLTYNTRLRTLYGTLAICQVDGIEAACLAEPETAPLRYGAFFAWLLNTVFYGSYARAANAEKN